MNKKFFIYIILLFIFSMCGKDKHNAMIQKNIEVSYFDKIVLENVFEVYLTQDTICSLMIEGDKEFVDKVTTEIYDSIITFKSDYKLDWLKPKSNSVKLFINIKYLQQIDANDPCYIESLNPLVSEEIGVIFNSKYSEAKLELNTHIFFYWNVNPCGGMLELYGKSKHLRLWNTALTTVNAKNLDADYVYMETNAKADSYIRAIKQIRYSIGGNGNIYYYGNPEEIIEMEPSTSDGKLIHVDE